MNEPLCIIDDKRIFKGYPNQRIQVFLDSLQVQLDPLGYLVSPSIINLRPFVNAPRIELAYLRTSLFEVWFPYLPFYRFNPTRQMLIIKAERLQPHNSSCEQFASVLDELYSEKYMIQYSPSQIPQNMIFCKCTNPPEEEHAILERKYFAEKILDRYFKVSDGTADKLSNIMLILDEYLEKFHTSNIPVFYYNLAGAAGDFELLTALISAVAGSPEALGLDVLASKGDLTRAIKTIQERSKQFASLLPNSQSSSNETNILREENIKLKRAVQQLLAERQQRQGGGQPG